MHFIFLGPGETGSWDAWLFWTQLALACAAILSPLLAHLFANHREREASRRADRRMEAANDAAMERERRAHENAERRMRQHRQEHSDAIFYAVKSESQEIANKLHQLRERWRHTNRVSPGRGEEMKFQTTPLFSEPTVWSNLTDQAQLDATVSLLGRIRDYNGVIEHFWRAQGQIVTRQMKDAINSHLDEVYRALRELQAL